MLLQNILKNKDASYVYMERYVNNGSPSGFDKIHTSSDNTSPRSEIESFDLYVIRFNDSVKTKHVGDEINVLENNCFFCHPDNLNNPIFQNTTHLWEIVTTVKAAPTASARTVKILGADYFVKLDYTGYLGRIRRNLDYQHLLSAHEVSRDICEGISSGKYNNCFGALKEDKGRVAYIPIEDGGFYEFGFIIREYKPFSSCSEDLYLIPGFSLFSNDYYFPQDKPILLQLYEKSGKNINDFAFNDILAPLFNCYFDALTVHGLALEAHAQNTLIAIDKNYKIRLIVARDMESVDKDIDLRGYLGVASTILSQDYKCIRRNDYNYTIKHSFMFDFKLGEYLISPLMDLFNTVPGFDNECIIELIKQNNARYLSILPANYFPDTWYNYENKQFEPNEKRPYISNPNPKYR